MFKTKYKVTKNKYLNTLKYKTFFAVIPQKTFMSKFLKNRQEVQVEYSIYINLEKQKEFLNNLGNERESSLDKCLNVVYITTVYAVHFTILKMHIFL